MTLDNLLFRFCKLQNNNTLLSAHVIYNNVPMFYRGWTWIDPEVVICPQLAEYELPE